MPPLSGLTRAALACTFLVSAVTGCSTITDTKNVRLNDTYDLWARRMPSLPVVFHTAGGIEQAYDAKGGSTGSTDVSVESRRIEIYLDSRTMTGTLACGSPRQSDATLADPSKEDVVASLCDGPRTVVSFVERARRRVLADKRAYIAHVHRVLMDGIWTSDAQTPDPTPL